MIQPSLGRQLKELRLCAAGRGVFFVLQEITFCENGILFSMGCKVFDLPYFLVSLTFRISDHIIMKNTIHIYIVKGVTGFFMAMPCYIAGHFCFGQMDGPFYV